MRLPTNLNLLLENVDLVLLLQKLLLLSGNLHTHNNNKNYVISDNLSLKELISEFYMIR